MTFYIQNVSGSTASLGLVSDVADNGIVDLEAIQGDGTPLHARVDILGNSELRQVVVAESWRLLEDDGSTPISTADAQLKLVPTTELAHARLEADVSGVSPDPVYGTTADPTLVVATWSDIPEMSVSITPSSTAVDVAFSASIRLAPSVTGATVAGQVRITVDGQAVANSTRSLKYTCPDIVVTPGEVIAHPHVVVRATGLTPDVAVTVKAQWSATSGTLRAVGIERTLRASYAR